MLVFKRNIISFTSFRSYSQVVKDVVKLKSFNSIPGPKSYPVIGTLHKYIPFIGDYNSETLHKNSWLNWTKYGPLVRESLMPGVDLLHVYHPEDVEAVFRQDDKAPHRRSHIAMQHYRINKPDVYKTGGLLATNGPEWYRLRSTFQKNFSSPQSVKNHTLKTDKIVQNFVSWIKESKDNAAYDFLPYLNRLYLEIIGEVAFDEKFDSFSKTEQEPNSRSSRTIKAAFESNSGIVKLDKGIMWRFINTPLYNKLAKSQEYLESVSNDILYKKVNFFESEHENRCLTSLLDSFLQQPDVDLKDIIGMMVDILMAAIDTTSYSTSFLLYHMANNMRCQEKAYDEILKILELNADITPDVLSKAVYVKSCIKESLRLNPVSIGVGRVLQKDIALRGYHVPEGTVIVTQSLTASRLPQFVENPLEFKPERWLRDSEHFENIHPFLSLPFGFGPRTCIARRLAEQNMMIVLLRMIREFKFEWKGGELGIKTLLINKPDKPINLMFEERSNSY